MRRPNRIERDILTAITDAVRTNGYPPSIRELCAMVDMKSTSTMKTHLDTMHAVGFIRRVPGSPRAITVIHAHTGGHGLGQAVTQ